MAHPLSSPDHFVGWWLNIEHWSLTGELSLVCTGPAADG